MADPGPASLVEHASRARLDRAVRRRGPRAPAAVPAAPAAGYVSDDDDSVQDPNYEPDPDPGACLCVLIVVLGPYPFSSCSLDLAPLLDAL